MFKLTRLIHFRPEADVAVRAGALAALQRSGEAHPLIRLALVEPTLPGHINGGDVLWHMQFDSEADYRTATSSAEWDRIVGTALTNPIISHIDYVAYEGGKRGERAGAAKIERSAYRLAFLHIARPLPAASVARFESDTLAMPSYIKEMRNWQLSRTRESAGLRPWTYVWEQEFADAADLGLDFTYSPYHWAHMGRWFEPDSPEYLIDTCICHVLCASRPGLPILT